MPADYNVTAWTAKVDREREYTTPTGAKCLVRDMVMEDLVDLDLINEIDSLTALVQTEHIDRVAGKGRKAQQKAKQVAAESERQQMMALMKDKAKFIQMATVLDKVVMRCVISPQLFDPWINDPNIPEGRRKLDKNERDPELAYIDYIPLADKISIFGEVFQSMDNLEKFREESASNLGAVEAQPEPAEDASGSDGADE